MQFCEFLKLKKKFVETIKDRENVYDMLGAGTGAGHKSYVE